MMIIIQLLKGKQEEHSACNSDGIFSKLGHADVVLAKGRFFILNQSASCSIRNYNTWEQTRCHIWGKATYHMRLKEPIDKAKGQDLFSVRVPTIGR